MVSAAWLQARGPHRSSLAELDRNGKTLFCMLQGRVGRVAYTALRDAIFAQPTLDESFNNLFLAPVRPSA